LERCHRFCFWRFGPFGGRCPVELLRGGGSNLASLEDTVSFGSMVTPPSMFTLAYFDFDEPITDKIREIPVLVLAS
jgi:hypothetical protein